MAIGCHDTIRDIVRKVAVSMADRERPTDDLATDEHFTLRRVY